MMQAAVEHAPSEQEILRQASVALQGRPVTMWEVVSPEEARPVVTSQPHPEYHQTALDVQETLQRWHVDIVPGSRWVGCRLDQGEGRWCVAPVRRRPAAPPPTGRERRSKERMTLELAALCVGLVDRRSSESQGMLPEGGSDGGAGAGGTISTGVIAHEVANPLGAARVTLDFCLEALEAPLPLEDAARLVLLDDLRAVAQAIDRAVMYLRSLRDRARVSVPRTERFDAVKVVHSCITLEAPLARRRGARLELVSGVEPVFLQGDPNGLYQILVNLIRNAVDASEGGLAPVVVSLEKVGRLLRLVVRDGGAGIPAEHLDRVFEPGFTTKPFGAGAGMGLAVVRDVVRGFGGATRIESAPGRGTSVVVDLEVPPQRGARQARAEGGRVVGR